MNYYFLTHTRVSKEIYINKGDSFSLIYTGVFEGLDTPPAFRIYLSKIKKMPANMKYGYYAADNATLDEYINNIMNGIETAVKVTIPEGYNLFEVASALLKNGIIEDKQLFIDKSLDSDTVKSVTGYNYKSMEGMLAPGTYRFPKRTDILQIIQTLYKTHLNTLPKDIEAKAAKHGLNPYEALILASIVQKETYSAEEAPTVASVFLNRLKLRMRLQADPTIIYGKYLEYDGNIHKTDILNAENIYNTYRHNGLTPTPICNPSVIAINAVLEPADTNYLYFVADKNGKHLFTADYRQHVNNVNKHQKR